MTIAEQAMNIHHKGTKTLSNSIYIVLTYFVSSCLGGKSLFSSWKDKNRV